MAESVRLLGPGAVLRSPARPRDQRPLHPSRGARRRDRRDAARDDDCASVSVNEPGMPYFMVGLLPRAPRSGRLRSGSRSRGSTGASAGSARRRTRGTRRARAATDRAHVRDDQRRARPGRDLPAARVPRRAGLRRSRHGAVPVRAAAPADRHPGGRRAAGRRRGEHGAGPGAGARGHRARCARRRAAAAAGDAQAAIAEWNGRAPANATLADWVSYAQLLPHASLVVSNGGHGTVARSLAEERPPDRAPRGRPGRERGPRRVGGSRP